MNYTCTNNHETDTDICHICKSPAYDIVSLLEDDDIEIETSEYKGIGYATLSNGLEISFYWQEDYGIYYDTLEIE